MLIPVAYYVGWQYIVTLSSCVWDRSGVENLRGPCSIIKYKVVQI